MYFTLTGTVKPRYVTFATKKVEIIHLIGYSVQSYPLEQTLLLRVAGCYEHSKHNAKYVKRTQRKFDPHYKSQSFLTCQTGYSTLS